MSDQDETQNSITLMLRRFGSGDAEATRGLFDIYFKRLTLLAEQFLPANRRRSRDQEDLAQDVMASFLMGMSKEDIALIKNRHHLWNALAQRIRQRAANVHRDDGRIKRGGGRLLTESQAFRNPAGAYDPGGIDQIADSTHDAFMGSPLEQLDQFNQQLLAAVTDEKLRPIATALLAGKTASEIAEDLNVSLATIYRRMQRIQEIWADHQH